MAKFMLPAKSTFIYIQIYQKRPVLIKLLINCYRNPVKLKEKLINSRFVVFELMMMAQKSIVEGVGPKLVQVSNCAIYMNTYYKRIS